ncbi:lysostaphin resistance A-like protein [Pseudomonas aeruginosa]
MEAAQHQRSGTDTVALCLFALFFCLASWITCIRVTEVTGHNAYNGFFQPLTFAISAIICVLVLNWQKVLTTSLVGKNFSLKVILFIAVVYLSYKYGAPYVANLFMDVPVEPAGKQFTRDMHGDLVKAGMLAVGTVILAPISEEIIFREILFKSFLPERSTTHLVIAMAFSSLCFGFMHEQYEFAFTKLYIAISGFFYVAARVWSGGLLLPILMHMAWNASSVARSFT